MAPITTYLKMCISSIFYILWDAHFAIEYFTHHNRLLFPFSTMGYSLTHPDLPILL
ncbi:hypothetical protein Lalb_Chr21g0306071 [Lupinus albus]|uniref:Uncharacterized protein n=1 Tax=Lupinus albus TaxID=3870 RepID=A0A6A4NRI0_LUPAL|nr:hypothetical protein Lalb_Chr21g0306071 [Lupinus albus]